MTNANRSGKSGLVADVFHSTPDQARDTGLALVLLCLLLVYFGNRPQWVPPAIVLLVLCMVWPKAFRPLAGVWFGLSHLLGMVTSGILLTILFFALVTPVGLVRRLTGADVLQLKKWKKDDLSVFIERKGAINRERLEKPY